MGLGHDRLATALKTLDFHHARDHLWAVAHLLHGEGTPEARAWVQPLLQSLREGREARVVRRLEQLIEATAGRPPARQVELEREVRYFQNHRNHLHYQAMEEAGAPRGSGAAESLGKQLQQRCAVVVRPGAAGGSPICSGYASCSRTVMIHSSGTENYRQPRDAPGCTARLLCRLNCQFAGDRLWRRHLAYV